ncbi:TraB/GumN family protein [Neobacillus mesonae]|nr:TraB/GumN family protein [Neobacillus mesonae]
MKKWNASLFALLLSVCMLLVPVLPAAAAVPNTDIEVNGDEIDFTSKQPVIEKGTAYAPEEDFLKALNASLVETDAKDSITVLVNGEEVSLTAQSKTINGTVYVPVRIVSEQMGYKVGWDAASRTIILSTGGKGFLWEVNHEGKTVYLVGSMHIADESFYPLDPSFEKAFAESEYLGVEVDISKPQDEAMQEMTLNLGMYQDGTTLKDHISSDAYEQIGEILTENGLEPDALDEFKPWMVENTLSTLKSLQSGYQGEIGIDLHFLEKAAERNIPVIELETYESQLRMLSGFSDELQNANLQAVIENYDVVDDSVDQLAKMWKQGDDAVLLEITQSMTENEEYYKAMLVDRNIGMADKIEGYLTGDEDGDYFIVVGALHYLGEDGIVKLLQDKGFTVTRK